MATINTIAIVGATEKAGAAIARSLNGKYRLLLMSEDETKLVALKSELRKSKTFPEVYAVSCARDAAWEADIIIIATSLKTEREVAGAIRDVAVGKIVISIYNPGESSKAQRPARSRDSSAAEELQRLLPYSKVVKTFDTSFATHFLKSSKIEKRGDVFIAGNNSNAVETVSEVVAEAGFKPVVVGDLTISRALERMQMILIKLAMKNNFSIDRRYLSKN